MSEKGKKIDSYPCHCWLPCLTSPLAGNCSLARMLLPDIVTVIRAYLLGYIADGALRWGALVRESTKVVGSPFGKHGALTRQLTDTLTTTSEKKEDRKSTRSQLPLLHHYAAILSLPSPADS